MAAGNTVKCSDCSPNRWPVPKPYWSYPTIEEPEYSLAELMQLDSSSLQLWLITIATYLCYSVDILSSGLQIVDLC
ncbi:unnamed protein product [Urochloa humidicola]